MKHKVRKAVFPVGGLGTRFLPATKALPKEMLPIIDKPLIQYAVEEARDSGIEEFIFVTGRGKAAIEDHFDHSYELNAILQERHLTSALAIVNDIPMSPGKICYTRQQEPLGLGHAVWCARHFIADEPFAVILADDLILAQKPCLKQMLEIYEQKGGNMVALLDVPQEETSKYGILDINHEEGSLVLAKGVVEKPAVSLAPSTRAIIGRYILDHRVFEFLDRKQRGALGEIQLTDSLHHMIPEVALRGLLFEGERFDCGSKEGLLEATMAFALKRDDMKEAARRIISYYQ
jgi:UTP--glucose-1-phosphate uridylyltransferase